MKNRIVTKLSALVAGVVLLGQAASSVSADTAPTLPYAAGEVLKLVQAKVGDDTIVAYISHAPTGYSLSASDLVYLRSQGVSDAVMSAMLTHSRPAEAVAQAAAPAPAPVVQAPAPAPVVVQAPATTTYVQAPPVVVAAPPTVVYDYGYYHPYYYGPRYYGPGISLSFGFGGHGGYRGGWHGHR